MKMIDKSIRIRTYKNKANLNNFRLSNMLKDIISVIFLLISSLSLSFAEPNNRPIIGKVHKILIGN